MAVIKGTTSSGFCYELDDQNLDNMELIDALVATEENPMYISKVCELMLGKELRRQLYDYLRTDDGRVPMEAVSENLAEIFEASTNGKK